MKPAKKHIAIITGIIFFLGALGVYSAFRSDSLEKEYVSILTLKNSKVLTLIGDPASIDSDNTSQLENSLQKIKENVPEIALVAVADRDYNIIVAGKNSKHAPRDGTIDEILSDFTQKKLESPNSFPLVIRYYDQSRFYIFLNELDSILVMTAFPYMMTNRQIISFALEAALIAIVFIILTMSVYIIIDRKEGGTIEPRPMAEDDNEEPEKDDPLRILDDCANLVNAETVTIETYTVEENVFEISAEYSNGKISIPGSGRKAAGTIHGELVNELERRSTVLLDKNKTCLVPLVHKGELKGVVRIIRPVPFKGADMNLVEEYITSHIDVFLNASKK